VIETAAEVIAVAALLGGVLFVRRRATGRLPDPWYWAACGTGIVAVTVGTAFRVSGVALAVPVIAVASVAIVRSRWWLGDAGLYLIVLAVGTAAAYLLVAAIDPDTGSSADQGALALALLGVPLCLAAVVTSLVRGRRRARIGRPG
jgi:hypothetical protein